MSFLLTVVGLPGSGKSTFAKAVAQARGLPLLSTGDHLRLLATNDPTLSRALSEGKLGPEELVQDLVDRFLGEHSMSVLDGYPRHRTQAQLLRNARIRVCVVHLAIPEAIALSRITQRPRRGDESHNVIRARIERDRAALIEVLEVLSDSLISCDATKSLKTILAEVLPRIPTEASNH